MKENMFYGASPIIFQRAEELRNRMTVAEKIVWDAVHINKWHLKFRRQHPISNYIADFYCHAIKLVIEIDGDIHDNEEVKRLDENRETFLKEIGLTILRFKNEEVFESRQNILEKIGNTINRLQSSPLGDGGKDILYVIKIGGNIIDDEKKLSSFLEDFASIKENKILIHGGGKLATKLAEQLGIPQKLIDGRRVTDADTLKIATMVYAGYINKNIVAQLQACKCTTIGLTGADGNSIKAHKRLPGSPLGGGGNDYGFVGDVDSINFQLLQSLLEKNITLVFAPLTHDNNGQLLNTNADTIAQEVAKALSDLYDVELIYCFEKKGVLKNASDDNTVISKINRGIYNDLKNSGAIFEGMIPKLDNAFTALNSGVKKVIIGNAEHINQLLKGEAGTTIINQ